jgi:hypothetical protein
LTRREDLTAEDLKELGVASLGHRRKLLDAIAALRTNASGKAPSADEATASSPPSVSPEDRAERRQVTVHEQAAADHAACGRPSRRREVVPRRKRNQGDVRFSS